MAKLSTEKAASLRNELDDLRIKRDLEVNLTHEFRRILFTDIPATILKVTIIQNVSPVLKDIF